MSLPPVGEVVARRTYRPDEVDLFLFSAACWLPHRVHFDRRFAMSEGLEDTPVQGPLQTSWLTELADEWARSVGGELRRVQVRNVASVYPGSELVGELTVTVVEETPDGMTVELSANVSRDGQPVTTGTAQASFPGTGAPV